MRPAPRGPDRRVPRATPPIPAPQRVLSAPRRREETPAAAPALRVSRTGDGGSQRGFRPTRWGRRGPLAGRIARRRRGCQSQGCDNPGRRARRSGRVARVSAGRQLPHWCLPLPLMSRATVYSGGGFRPSEPGAARDHGRERRVFFGESRWIAPRSPGCATSLCTSRSALAKAPRRARTAGIARVDLGQRDVIAAPTRDRLLVEVRRALQAVAHVGDAVAQLLRRAAQLVHFGGQGLEVGTEVVGVGAWRLHGTLCPADSL